MTNTRRQVLRRWAATLMLLSTVPLDMACINGPQALAHDKTSLLAALRGMGLTVSSAGMVRQPFLAPVGQGFAINHVARDTIQVFEYADSAAATRDTAKIRPDGSIPGLVIDWIGQPHFYRMGRLVVIYPGTTARVLAALRAVVGKPFAVGAPKNLTRAVRDKTNLLSALRGMGLIVSTAGAVRQPFLAPVGEGFTINHIARDTIQIFEYPDLSAATRDTAKIRPDGSIPGIVIDWIDQPHFYRAGRLVVIYPGTTARVLAALQAVVGKPFAVGPKR
jgi:hypothetical protein